MRRVPEQRHAAARPAGPRLAVVQHPVLVLADVAEHLLDAGRGVRERFGELVGPAVVAPLAALEALARDGGDVVHDRAPAQAVLHEMQVGADPDDHVVEMRAVLDLVEGHHPAVAYVADRPRRAVADQDLAHARAQAVGAYHGRALVFRAVGEAREHAAGRFIEAHQLLRGVQGDLLALAAGFEQRAVKVAAVHDGVGRAEVPAEFRPAGDARELAVGERVDEDQVPGEHRLRFEVLHHSQPVEHAVGVGPLLDAVADLAELGRFLEDPRAHAAAGERERGRAAADDEDFRRSFCLRHLWFPASEDPGPSLGSDGGNVPARTRFYIPSPRRSRTARALQWTRWIPTITAPRRSLGGPRASAAPRTMSWSSDPRSAARSSPRSACSRKAAASRPPTRSPGTTSGSGNWPRSSSAPTPKCARARDSSCCADCRSRNYRSSSSPPRSGGWARTSAARSRRTLKGSSSPA